jgi:hypothetical protein
MQPINNPYEYSGITSNPNALILINSKYMNNQEFSNQFDVLVSSYRRFRDFDNKEPRDTIEFDEFEKSFYLTKAQEEVVVNLYNGRNPYGVTFEGTEELRRYLEG